jgi:hypothetical protein
MFCLLNQAFATIDHLIWDAVVALHGPNARESRHKRPAGGGGIADGGSRRGRMVWFHGDYAYLQQHISRLGHI